MLQKTRALILHSLKYGDSSLIIHAFTEKWGRSSFLLKGVRKSKKQNRANMFQPFFLLELDIYYKDNREFQWIKEASFLGSLPMNDQDMVKSAQAIFLSEVLMKTVREEEKNPALFEFLVDSISFFNDHNFPLPSYHIVFLFQLSRFLGFYPKNNYSEERPYFRPESGAFSQMPGSAKVEQEKLLGRQWKFCFNANYLNADQEFSQQALRNLFLDSLLSYYDHHHPSLADLKSLDVLRTVFS